MFKLRFQHNVKLLCRVLKVNRSTYYKHFFVKPTKRTNENIEIRKKILSLYSTYDKRLSVKKIHYFLECDFSIKISLGRVYRLTQNMQLPQMATAKPRVKPAQGDDSLECINHLKQNFNQKAPNIVWVSDITYIRIANRFYYLCVIIDLYSRKVIAFQLSPNMKTQFVIDTFNLAIKVRNPKGLMFHSDRGCQYTSKEFRKVLDEHNVTQSFSKKGHPYDNAVAESFFKFLKKEEINRRNYQTIKDLELSVFSYIEGYYNAKRPHGSLNNLTPNQMEALANK